jgi:hypothetical protein
MLMSNLGFMDAAMSGNPSTIKSGRGSGKSGSLINKILFDYSFPKRNEATEKI